jgi:polyisoprenoid-binding protein YceI
METAEKKIAAVETKWALDPSHSEIAFKVKHMMIANVKGLFKEFEINVTSNGVDFSDAQIDFQMKAASIETGDANRDGHLKSADFFDVENFPLITFKSSSLKNIEDENYELVGDLTIRGVAKTVKLDVEFGGVLNDPWGNTKAGFTLNGKISRKEFGLVWNAALESGGVLVGDDVKIACEVELAKQA